MYTFEECKGMSANGSIGRESVRIFFLTGLSVREARGSIYQQIYRIEKMCGTLYQRIYPFGERANKSVTSNRRIRLESAVIFLPTDLSVVWRASARTCSPTDLSVGRARRHFYQRMYLVFGERALGSVFQRIYPFGEREDLSVDVSMLLESVPTGCFRSGSVRIFVPTGHIQRIYPFEDREGRESGHDQGGQMCTLPSHPPPPPSSPGRLPPAPSPLFSPFLLGCVWFRMLVFMRLPSPLTLHFRFRLTLVLF